MVGLDQHDLANSAVNTTVTDDRASLNPRPSMNGLDESMSIGNAWIAYLPIEDILGKRYKNLDLHLRNFSIPQMEMGSSEVSYKGYSKCIPTKVLNAGTKEITLTYLIDENWQNYKSLWAWCLSPTGTLNPVTDDNALGINPTSYLTMRIYLMNNYLKKIVQFEFYNVWIKVFNDLQLDVTSTDPIEHSFTIAYDDMRMVEI